LIGRSQNSDILRSHFSGDVIGSSYTGGLVGDYYNGGSLINSSANGTVGGVQYVGGLVGDNSNDMLGCHFNGTVNGASESVGGLMGYSSGGSVNKSSAIGRVTGSSNYVGGLVGANRNTPIQMSYFNGSVSNTGSTTGGLVGYNYGSSLIRDCYAVGSVSGSISRSGGLVGWNAEDVTRSYAAVDISGSSGSNIGGFIGFNSATLTFSFWDFTVGGGTGCGSGVCGVTGLATPSMMQQATFTGAGWDFIGVWNITEDVTYPFFIWDVGVPGPGPGPEPACSDEQTIMKLYFLNNSHGALWNDAIYNERICHDDIFGYEYSGANPHSCDGNNSVIYLSNFTNAHASTFSDPNYSTPVCYGGLYCVADGSAGNDCVNPGYEIVIRLSNYSNAHISEASYTDHPVKICCGASPPVFAPGGRWEDMDGVEIGIPAGINASVGDTVAMNFYDSEWPPGTEVNFEVYEDDTWPNSDDFVTTKTGIVAGDSTLIAFWTITDEDYNVGSDHDRYNFRVTAQDGTPVESTDLEIDENYNNGPLYLNIDYPPCGANFSSLVAVDIGVSASDPDDSIDGLLEIYGPGGSLVNSYSFTNGGLGITTLLGGSGNFQIVADATTDRGERRRDISNIMMIDQFNDGVYVAACISEPPDYSNIPTSVVNFVATDSRGVRRISGNDTSIPIEEMNFYWTFSDGLTNSHTSGSDSLSHEFFKLFRAAGENWAELIVEVV